MRLRSTTRLVSLVALLGLGPMAARAQKPLQATPAGKQPGKALRGRLDLIPPPHVSGAPERLASYLATFDPYRGMQYHEHLYPRFNPDVLSLHAELLSGNRVERGAAEQILKFAHENGFKVRSAEPVTPALKDVLSGFGLTAEHTPASTPAR
jgi:hypothetical protein